MARGISIMLVVITLMLMEGIDAESHTVKWILPPSTDYYPNWAGNESFAIGDTLVFVFPTNAHTVAEVTTKEGFNQCLPGDNAVIHKIGPTTITLDKAKTYYFICTIGRHCDGGGQKLAVTVPSSASDAPSRSKHTTEKGSSAPPLRIASSITFCVSVGFVTALLYILSY